MITAQEKTPNCKNIAGPFQISYLCGFLKLGVEVSIDGLRKACVSASYDFSSNFDDTVIFLTWLGILNAHENKVVLRIPFREDELLKIFFEKMAKQKSLHLFIPCSAVTYSEKSKLLQFRNSLIPLRFSAYRNFLLKFNLFIINNYDREKYQINEHYNEWFIREIIPLIEDCERKFTLEQLKRKNESNAQLGLSAEEYVLNRERDLFSSHPRVQAIRIISEDYASAGYDIKSFMSVYSVALDKECEVKSYSGTTPSFYWSKNEIDRAKHSGDNYFLYIVNRDSIYNSDYHPIIIQNPHLKIISRKDGWISSVESLYFEKV